MKRLSAASMMAGSFLLLCAQRPEPVHGANRPRIGNDDARIERGFRISPVPLDLEGKNPNLVGLGSYIVNAQAVCADCHSCPTYALGHNPYLGQPKMFNIRNYLAGGVPFGPQIVSANITPDENGLPGGLTFDQYLNLIRTGHDPEDPDEIIPVMPWPVYQDMLTSDIRAVYEYLRAIPSAVSGADCTGPGQ
jgi:hypothetical protein